jgi:probable rRNA maturation factor
MPALLVDDSVRDRLTRAERARLRGRLGRMVRAAALAEDAEQPLEVSLRLTDDPAMRALNREYRGKDRPTDVLAFAMREAEDGALAPEVLGDIVISVDTASRQARRGLFHELMFLSAHGLCHLLGYDHQTDEQETTMNRRMKALLDEAGRRGPTRAA